VTPTDDTLDPSTVASLAPDVTYVADEAAAAAIGETSVAAAESAEQADRDQAAWRAANGSL
jgi:hypothetical protein